MATKDWIVLAFGVALMTYLVVVVGLFVAGRRIDVRGLAGVLVSCLGLLRRLMADARVARRHKIALAGALGYLAMPFDLVPDFLPVVGYLDDALVVALAVRLVLNSAGRGVVTELWNGSERVLGALLRVSEASLWPGIGALARIAGVGALGLAVCVWVDVADNCAGGLTCRENDPMLLNTGRGIAVAVCAAGVLGLAARALGPSRFSPFRARRAPRHANRRS